MRQRSTLCGDERMMNQRRIYKNCKYIQIQLRITSIYKATANKLKRRN